MTRSEIITDMTRIFHDVFDDDGIVLSDGMTADDVAKWGSLHHVNLIVTSFGIKFRTTEIEALTTIGDLVNTVPGRRTLVLDGLHAPRRQRVGRVACIAGDGVDRAPRCRWWRIAKHRGRLQAS